MLPPGTLTAVGLYLTRTSALVLAAPLLGTGASFAGYKVALIGALSLLLYTVTGAPLAEPVGPIEFGALALREVLIGVALAFVLHAALLAVRVAGELIGQEMGLNMSSQIDPTTGSSTPVVAQVYESLFLIGLLAVDGHHWLIRALAESFERAPVGSLAAQSSAAGSGLSSTAQMIEGLFGQMFTAGLAFAAPVLVLMFVVSLVTGLLARAVPQLNLLESGFTLRILAALVAMYAFAPLLAPAMEQLHGALHRGLEDVLGSLQGEAVR